MEDTWSDIQAIKTKQQSLREKMLRRKREREGLVAGITGATAAPAGEPVPQTSETENKDVVASSSPAARLVGKSESSTNLPTVTEAPSAGPSVKVDSKTLTDIEREMQMYLSDVTLNFPISATFLRSQVSKALEHEIPPSAVEDLLEKFSAQQLVTLTRTVEKSGEKILEIASADHSKLSAVNEEEEGRPPAKKLKSDSEPEEPQPPSAFVKPIKTSNITKAKDDSVESLLSMHSAKERENKKLLEEIQQLLSQPTAKEQSLVEKFKSQGGAQVQGFCQYGTREDCIRSNNRGQLCEKLHFKKIIHKHTDETLGDCSFLNTCFHMDTCKYVHYEIDYPDTAPASMKVISKMEVPALKRAFSTDGSTTLFPPQWVQCDMRYLDLDVLGKFSVIMADPPWDIHMELPYGTMSDEEMRKLQVPMLQDHGYVFLWVTGRAMELGRECLKLWGYERIDELIWVKTNQLQRIIRTGRTGHWLNHGKEHCLVGVKGNPKNINRGLDCDVIVAEVRATSHKPDEIYGIIERLSPGTRKIELFGRPHNAQPNWVTLGNQLDGVRLLEPDVVRRFKKRYPNGYVMGQTN